MQQPIQDIQDVADAADVNLNKGLGRKSILESRPWPACMSECEKMAGHFHYNLEDEKISCSTNKIKTEGECKDFLATCKAKFYTFTKNSSSEHECDDSDIDYAVSSAFAAISYKAK
eukprot:Nk52_evm1s286 gene=Nk52_evmTU1s286